MGANQNAQKLQSTDLVNTNNYCLFYNRLSLNRHLYKKTLVERTPRAGPYLSLILLFDSLKDGRHSKTLCVITRGVHLKGS